MTATPGRVPNAPGAVEGFECGDSSFNWDIPANCPAGTQLNVRYQAPSCWDGIHLDSADHKSHMAYPVNGECPASHPVAVPMIEFKMSWPGQREHVATSGSPAVGATRSTTTSSTRGTRPCSQALVEHCINGGLQCNPRGYDLYKPWAGAVLDANYQLIP